MRGCLCLVCSLLCAVVESVRGCLCLVCSLLCAVVESVRAELLDITG